MQSYEVILSIIFSTTLTTFVDEQDTYVMKKKDLSGGFSLGWPVTGIGSVTDPGQFSMFGTLDPNVLHTPKIYGFEVKTAEPRLFL